MLTMPVIEKIRLFSEQLIDADTFNFDDCVRLATVFLLATGKFHLGHPCNPFRGNALAERNGHFKLQPAPFNAKELSLAQIAFHCRVTAVGQIVPACLHKQFLKPIADSCIFSKVSAHGFRVLDVEITPTHVVTSH